MTHLGLFQSLTPSAIAEFVTLSQEEGIHLDFKLARDASLNSTDDRRNFACAVSGFANSAGGLIVWGIEARKNPEGIDCAVANKPIANPKLLCTRLNTLTGDAVDPTVDGVQNRAVECDDGTGYVLTLVPESDRGPHMAKLGENRYYKRNGDGFYKMEHYDIADMFGRRRKPHLEVFYRVVGAFEVHIGLRNAGRGTARAPFFAFSTEGQLHRSRFGLDGNGNEGMRCMQVGTSNYQWAYGGGLDFALHPGMSHEVAKLNPGLYQTYIPTADLKIRYAIASEESPLESGELVVPVKVLALGAA